MPLSERLWVTPPEAHQLIIDDPVKVAQLMTQGIQQVHDYRAATQDAFTYNWRLFIDRPFQEPFALTHENMAGLNLSTDQPAHELAAAPSIQRHCRGQRKAPGVAAVKLMARFSYMVSLN